MAHAGRGDAGDTAGLPLFLILIAGIGRAFLLQGIHEEWWFRGFAFRGYRERPVLVLAATTVFFTLLHLVSSGGQQSASELFLYLALPLGMGFWAGVERLRTDTVWVRSASTVAFTSASSGRNYWGGRWARLRGSRSASPCAPRPWCDWSPPRRTSDNPQGRTPQDSRRRTISLIQMGAKGDVQFGGVG